MASASRAGADEPVEAESCAPSSIVDARAASRVRRCFSEGSVMSAPYEIMCHAMVERVEAPAVGRALRRRRSGQPRARRPCVRSILSATMRGSTSLFCAANSVNSANSSRVRSREQASCHFGGTNPSGEISMTAMPCRQSPALRENLPALGGVERLAVAFVLVPVRGHLELGAGPHPLADRAAVTDAAPLVGAAELLRFGS